MTPHMGERYGNANLSLFASDFLPLSDDKVKQLNKPLFKKFASQSFLEMNDANDGDVFCTHCLL